MTHMLSIAIVVLVFLFYLSTHTLIIPLTFGYLFFLYNLKELPKSKYKSSLWIFGILGMIISLLYSDLLIIQEILVMMCVSVLAYMMDEKTYHGILSGLTVIFGLPLAQMIAYEKNTTFGSNIYSGICLGAIILSFALFYFYNYLNQYLNDIPQPKEINLPKKYPFILKISIILMTVIGFLYSFQKLYIQFREGETMYYLYTPTKKDSPILPEYPISVSVSESSFFFSNIETNQYILSQEFYQYERLYFDIGFDYSQFGNRDIVNLSFKKQQDAPATIQEASFYLPDYYDEIDTGVDNHYAIFNQATLKSIFDQSILYIRIFGCDENFQYSDPYIAYLKPSPIFISGESLGMKFGFDYHANQEYLYISPNITYSPYLTPYLSKANSRTVALVATNKNTGESKEVTSWKDTNEYQYFYASNYCYLEISEPLDFELYEYTIEVTFYENQKGNTSFKGGDGEVKIICELENKDTLESFFAPYQDLPLILVQKEIAYEKPALVFDMHQLNAMKDILDQLITVSDELLGERNGRWYTISIDEILFVEGLSRDTYVYTMNGSYRIKERISTLEEQWGNYSYTRISKSMIVNTKQVQYIIPTIASKLILHMSNHMEIEVSRAYANQFKKKMKVKK